MSAIEAATSLAPAHVPPALNRPYPFKNGVRTKQKPHSFIAAIHEGPAVFWAEGAYHGVKGAWVPRRLADLQFIYNDHEHFSSRTQMPVQELIGEDWELIPAEIDPPRHGIYRAMFNPLFGPQPMAALEGKIRDYARGFIVAFQSKGQCEFMSEFAHEFPIKVFLELMGLPQSNVKQFLKWENSLLNDPDPQRLGQTARSIVDYLNGEIDARRSNPGDDLISYALKVETNGRKLTPREMTGFCFLMFLGGLDTVSVNMAWQFLYLAEHHEHQAALRKNPEMIPSAIDEIMRSYAAVTTSRECIKETTIGGALIKPGDRIMMPTYLAGRDPEAFPNPGTVILDRKPRHISFGYGPHLCIGMHLARREMRIAMEEFFTHIPEFSLAPEAEIEYSLGQVMAPTSIPMVWNNG